MTKKQRNDAYRWAYEYLDTEFCPKHICGTLRGYVYGRFRLYRGLSDMPFMFPEFGLFEPRRMPFETTNWFPYNKEGQNERLTCLAFCIAMTEND